MELLYTSEYYNWLRTGSSSSAAAVVPVIMQIMQPKSVIDIGCGTGAWLAEFKHNGILDLLGVDGAYLDLAQLQIDPCEFMTADLALPFSIQRRFDLAISLEVAEHLPQTRADSFVETLTRLAPVVLFSAAVPGQGGDNHLNEQWPSYWAERFEVSGFAALDPFRQSLWQRSDVDWWYAQNMLLFIQHDLLPRYRSVLPESAKPLRPEEIPPLVHPSNYRQHLWHNRVLQTALDLVSVIPVGERLILVDDDRFGHVYLPDRVVLPFVEHKGTYYGPPSDDDHAIEELRRMQQVGASFIAFGWPAFWWLRHYRRFAAYLEQNHKLILHNERVVCFRL